MDGPRAKQSPPPVSSAVTSRLCIPTPSIDGSRAKQSSLKRAGSHGPVLDIGRMMDQEPSKAPHLLAPLIVTAPSPTLVD
ncbi:hypothetical protein J6590_002751 [Homalodisca vitripennis]|nr:hypothetical protein J6590_002751 [Homalodisca vitripennis]